MNELYLQRQYFPAIIITEESMQGSIKSSNSRQRQSSSGSILGKNFGHIGRSQFIRRSAGVDCSKNGREKYFEVRLKQSNNTNQVGDLS